MIIRPIIIYYGSLHKAEILWITAIGIASVSAVPRLLRVCIACILYAYAHVKVLVPVEPERDHVQRRAVRLGARRRAESYYYCT